MFLIELKDLYKSGDDAFVIVWSDGISMEYKCREVQKVCRCALCENRRQLSGREVGLHSFKVVGRYAMMFTFTSGCSRGMYSIQFLRTIGKMVRQ